MLIKTVLPCLLLAGAATGYSEENQKTAYFIDGYHGGVYGHYPPGYTGFLVEQLRQHPEWKLNLEIEPETWDVARTQEPEAYREFQELMHDQSDAGRIEMVNPTYAQSYFFQSSGETAIRQFDHGIRKLHSHFPDVVLTTYSSEEPCFTSCLPGILDSFGYEFASLKNPNTCWGGYTAAYGGELVNWIGPDGTSLLTVPRYACESLHPTDPWQTIASGNSPEYIAASFEQGIEHPIGMCLQDAGWGGGPWLKWSAKDHYRPTEVMTWRDYIRNVTPAESDDDWHFSQEDVKPGLMWGAQVLQRIAQQSRNAENRLLTAEKIAAMARVDAGRPARTSAFDEAWHNVLLSQHHDCWIVPYNGRPGNTWADQVRDWTNLSQAVSDYSLPLSLGALMEGNNGRNRAVQLFNPTATALDTVVPVTIWQEEDRSATLVSRDAGGRQHPTQLTTDPISGERQLLVRAQIPPMGHATVTLHEGSGKDESNAAQATPTRSDELLILENDQLRLTLDPAKGGTIRSLVAKHLDDREFVDRDHERRFNELRGHFYEQDGFHSSADQEAQIEILENGPLRARVAISGTIAGHPFVQRITLSQGSPVIDCDLRIDWQSQPRIGEFEEEDGWHNKRRAAYDDRFKLLALFPAALNDQKIAKNAPFDVTESELDNTFFQSWEELKHNVILDWVDVTSGADDYGLALFSDHTTSYTHGEEFPLGLTLQYAGKGLWARDYATDGPTELRYALMPHAGKWDQSNLSARSRSWQQPVVADFTRSDDAAARSLIDPGNSRWQIPSFFEHEDALLVRLFNGAGDDTPQEITLGFEPEAVTLVELDGRVREVLTPERRGDGTTTLRLAIPRFGIRTLRLTGIPSPSKNH
jgi:alpha-mannosidase